MTCADFLWPDYSLQISFRSLVLDSLVLEAYIRIEWFSIVLQIMFLFQSKVSALQLWVFASLWFILRFCTSLIYFELLHLFDFFLHLFDLFASLWFVCISLIHLHLFSSFFASLWFICISLIYLHLFHFSIYLHLFDLFASIWFICIAALSLCISLIYLLLHVLDLFCISLIYLPIYIKCLGTAAGLASGFGSLR